MAKTKKKQKSATQAKRTQGHLCWYFPSTGRGEDSGFSDSLLEYFQGDHEKYVAREAIQNAVDARLDYSSPVTVVFERSSVPVGTFPGLAEFSDCLRRCLAFVKGQEKAETFYKSAIALLKEKKLPVLRIMDFNTKGLSGEDEDVDGNWYRLVKAAGTSSPKGAAGGSFGIGKGAPFAASSLRTVFYSSVNDKGKLVCQGKARLVSHRDIDNDVRQGVGFYGVNGYQAIRDTDRVPNLFSRNERGTDIFIMGYKSGPDWQQKLVRSVLSNFWLAIHRGDLEVVIRDESELSITKDTLRDCLEEYDALEAKNYYETLTNSSQTFEQDLKHLGKTTLYVRKDDNYPGRVMMARKPKMVVQEKGYRVLREPYAGVFICENDRGNALLRDLEPPAHDKWDPARAANGSVILLEMDSFVRQSLKSMADSLTSEPEDIPGLSSYLPDSDDRDYLPSNSGDALEETGTSSAQESGREVGIDRTSEGDAPIIIKRTGIVTNKQPGAVRLSFPHGPGDGPRGRGTGTDDGDITGVRIKTSTINFRSFIQKGKQGLEYHFAITGREDCEGAIRIVAVGDDGNYAVDLTSATDLKSGTSYEIEDSIIKGLKIGDGIVTRIAVRLTSDKRYTLGIETYEG